MEETFEKPGFFSRLAGLMSRPREDEQYDDFDTPQPSTLRLHTSHRYSVTVRRQVVSFQDAVAAADGIKRGEQQILNLSMASPELREKIRDFMCGVNYNAEGTWEELGEHVYMLAPAMAYVEVAPASPRMTAQSN
ncbi:MAG: cell division protein SepF [Fimbriimonadaceae bacterium]|nr:cell division protein SepF [Fimbriimonadaceae bacterium]QYK59402.1 MAG: cell division protein SepF [Fimbriimonadaceae bacterium]